MVNTENREFLMDMTYADYLMFNHKSGLPAVVEEHISVDVFLNGLMIDRFMYTTGPSRNWKLTKKTLQKLKFKLYTDKPEGINWDGNAQQDENELSVE